MPHSPEPISHILTFDVEEWHHGLDFSRSLPPDFAPRVPDQIDHLLAILHAANTHATFFILGSVAERHPDTVRAIDRAGHEIASHGYDHTFVYQRSPAEFEADAARSRAVLQALTNQPIRGYRAPYFSITHQSRWALPILRKLGFTYDSSVFPILNHRYGMPNAPREPHLISTGLLELPPATYRLCRTNIPCGGGAYFRIWPYALTRWFFRRLPTPAVFYLHPWELDPAHPNIQAELTGSVKYTHYWQLHRTEARLIRLLWEFRFGPVSAVFPAR